MADHSSPPAGRPLVSRTGLAALAFLVIAGFFLVSEHRAHVLGVLPFLLLLACPLLHFLHHGGHSEPDNGATHDDHGRRGE